MYSFIAALFLEQCNQADSSPKQRLTIARFRERWEKLKESAKRKRSARAVAEAQARAGGSGVNETIPEEPELEDVAG